MRASIHIMPKDGILDPQGDVIARTLRYLGFKAVGTIRMGRHIRMKLKTSDRLEAEKLVKESCERLLVNPNIEVYRFELIED